MFDDFFIRALIAGLGIALVTGPLGCFVVWRRLSYFGDTLSHSALLGVTLAYSFELNIALSVFIISSLIALILIQLQKKTNLPRWCFAWSIGSLIFSSRISSNRFFNIYSFWYYGTFIWWYISRNNWWFINHLDWWAVILLVLKLIWKPLFASTVNYELAEAEGLKPW